MTIDELKKVKFKDIMKVGVDNQNENYRRLGLPFSVPIEDNLIFDMDENISDEMVLKIMDYREAHYKSIKDFYEHFKKSSLNDALIVLYDFYQYMLNDIYGWHPEEDI